MILSSSIQHTRLTNALCYANRKTSNTLNIFKIFKNKKNMFPILYLNPNVLSFHQNAYLSHNKNGYNYIRWILFGSITAVTCIAFMPEIKRGASKHTAELASQSLREESLLIQTQQLASDIVHTVLNDPKVLEGASSFIKQVLEKENTRDSVIQLGLYLLSSPEIKHILQNLSSDLILYIIQDPKLKNNIVHFCKDIIKDPKINESIMSIIFEIIDDPTIRSQLGELMVSILLKDIIKDTVTSVLTNSTHSILSNQEIQNHAKQFVSTVIKDQTVQVQSSDAMWNAFTHTFSPKWISWIWLNKDSKVQDKKSNNKEVAENSREVDKLN